LIAQPLAASAHDRAAGALCVVNTKLCAIGIAEIEFGEVTVKMSL
jgi:hypothetical protein